jgi:hypothetical protein
VLLSKEQRHTGGCTHAIKGRLLMSASGRKQTLLTSAQMKKPLSFDKGFIFLARPAGFEPTTPWFVGATVTH